MKNNYVTRTITIEDAELFAKNFSGEKNDGNKSFGVYLDEDLAADMEEEGWPIKYHHDYNGPEDAPDRPCIYPKVKFDKIPPIIVMITDRGKIKLSDKTVEQLDHVLIDKADLKIRPYNYPEMKGRPAGVACYLKSLYVTLSDDDLDAKYAHIPLIRDEEEDYEEG